MNALLAPGRLDRYEGPASCKVSIPERRSVVTGERQWVRGRVERARVARGSKSERETLVLVTPDERLVLRRRGGNPFEVDQELASLEGRTIEIGGAYTGTTFLVDAWREAGDHPPERKDPR